MAKKKKQVAVEVEADEADEAEEGAAPTAPPRKSTKRERVIMVRLSAAEHALLVAIAAEAEMDMSSVLRRLLRQFGWRLSRH